jgi:hypothetical protein
MVIGLRLFVGQGEDSWIKDEKGVWIKHGMPASIPTYVEEQQEIINCSLGLYDKALEEGINFSSQCLGTCGNYAVDIVHVPRIAEDDKVENQCSAYREGKVTGFIELDKERKIVRIV